MGDDFRRWRLQDIARASGVIDHVLVWVGDLRHSATESMENEDARTHRLSDALVAFVNERLAPTTGRHYTPRVEDFKLADRLTVVEGSFVESVLAVAIPAYGKTVGRLGMDGRYWLPSQRDAWRLIEHSLVNTFLYIADQFDCDDYTEALRNDFRMRGVNSCAAIVDWSSRHAFNMLIFPNGEYWFVEPQRDKIVPIGADIYKMENALLII